MFCVCMFDKYSGEIDWFLVEIEKDFCKIINDMEQNICVNDNI